MIKELLHSDGTVTTIPVKTDTPAGTAGNDTTETEQVTRCTRIAPHQISDIIGAPGEKDILWLDIENPTEADLTLLREEFHLHLLAIEDIRTRNQRPKVDDYGTFVHIVIYAAQRTEADGMVTHEIDLFYSDHYLIAVHGRPSPRSRRRLTAGSATLTSSSTASARSSMRSSIR